jgi:hypothetical protein
MTLATTFTIDSRASDSTASDRVSHHAVNFTPKMTTEPTTAIFAIVVCVILTGSVIPQLGASLYDCSLCLSRQIVRFIRKEIPTTMMDLVMIDQAVDLVVEVSVVHAVDVVRHAAIHLAQVRGRRQMEGLAHGLLLCDWPQLVLISSE